MKLYILFGLRTKNDDVPEVLHCRDEYAIEENQAMYAEELARARSDAENGFVSTRVIAIEVSASTLCWLIRDVPAVRGTIALTVGDVMDPKDQG